MQRKEEETCKYTTKPSRAALTRAKLLKSWYSHLSSIFGLLDVTHCPPLTQILQIHVNDLGTHWLRQSLVACSAPSHYLNQFWYIINWTIRDTFQWKFNQCTKTLIKKMHLKMALAKFPPFCLRDNGLWLPKLMLSSTRSNPESLSRAAQSVDS